MQVEIAKTLRNFILNPFNIPLPENFKFLVMRYSNAVVAFMFFSVNFQTVKNDVYAKLKAGEKKVIPFSKKN